MKINFISLVASATLIMAAPAMAQTPTGVGGPTGPVTGGAVGGAIPGPGAGNGGPQAASGGATTDSNLGSTSTPNSSSVDAGTKIGAGNGASPMGTGAMASKTSHKGRSKSHSTMPGSTMAPNATPSGMPSAPGVTPQGG